MTHSTFLYAFYLFFFLEKVDFDKKKTCKITQLVKVNRFVICLSLGQRFKRSEKISYLLSITDQIGVTINEVKTMRLCKQSRQTGSKLGNIAIQVWKNEAITCKILFLFHVFQLNTCYNDLIYMSHGKTLNVQIFFN